MGKAALGTLLKIQDDATATLFNTVGGVENISGPGLSLDMAETTDHDSTWEEMVPTILRTGEITFDINLDQNSETTHQTLLTRLKNKTNKVAQIVFPDDGTTTWEFAGYVTGFNPTMNTPDKLTAAITFKPTGVPTLDLA